MYLTAQRVVSPDRRRTGINAFLYSHGTAPLPKTHGGATDVAAVAEQLPGFPQAEHVELLPGRNHVRSLVDVAGPDGMTEADVTTVFVAAERMLEKTGLPLVLQGPISVYFTAEHGLFDHLHDELSALKGAALALLGHPEATDWRSSEPLAIEVVINASGTLFRVEPGTVARVREKHGSDWKPSTVQVSHDVRHDLVAYGHDILHSVATALFSPLQADEILRLGGYAFRLADTGEVLDTWPRR